MLAELKQCDHDLLRQLLNGSLSEQAEATVTTHLESCESCRQVLENLAAGEGWWRETHELLAGQASAAVHAARPGRDSPSCPESPDPPSLAFLAPSDNPAMLGRLGEFEVLEFIGRGGMGLVLKGYDHELNRFVAIKVLGLHYAEHAAARRRFAREAQAAAAVVHPHVVAIHAVDATHQPPYFVMPFVPGESLQQRLDRTGPIEVTEVLRIGQQVADGLAAAHAQGLVHRDIKPANILLERNVERVLLTDFGLARAIDDASLTQSGVIAGTPQYMSPEQARGEAIDHRTDLFSLGSVLYAMLTGHSPFRADSPYAVIRRVNEETPRPLREVNSQVPEWLEALVGRLLAKKPDDRWQSAKEVAEILKDCLAHVQQPTAVALPSQVTALVRHPVNRIAVWTIAATAAIALILAVWWRVPEPNHNATKTLFPGVEKQTMPNSESANSTSNQSIQDEWDDQIMNDVEQVDERLQVLETDSEF